MMIRVDWESTFLFFLVYSMLYKYACHGGDLNLTIFLFSFLYVNQGDSCYKYNFKIKYCLN